MALWLLLLMREALTGRKETVKRNRQQRCNNILTYIPLACRMLIKEGINAVPSDVPRNLA